MKAAQSIKAACPTQIVLTAPGRLAAMQSRLEAINARVDLRIAAVRLEHALGRDAKSE